MTTNSGNGNTGNNGVARNGLPTISATAVADVLEVDESETRIGPPYRSEATANFADNFTVNAGTGATVSYALSLASHTGVDSGLFRPVDGAKIFLFEENGKIVGRAGNKGADGAADTPDKSGRIVFEVSVDANGVVKVQLGRGVKHNDPNDPDDVISLAADAITLTATVTDSNGNRASADLKLGNNIKIKDSAPRVEVWDWLPLRVLEVDESDLGTDATQDFSRNFNVRAEDGTPSRAATSVTLSVASETGVDSGVIDAATGARIFLFQGATSGEIVGRVGTKGVGGAADTADPNGAVAFAVSVADLMGNIRLDQKRGLKHGDPNNANEFVSLAADSITMTVTITDNDGDSASAGLKLGSNIRFKDDVPTANDDKDTVAKDGAAVATGNVVTGVDVGTNPDANARDGVADALGADGFGSIAWTGASNGSVAGTYGTLSVGTDGGYRYTLNNDSAAVRALTAGQTLTETFTYRVTDKDGDSSNTASLTVTIYGAQGEVPAVSATAAAADVLEVDESEMSTRPFRSEATANFADNFTVNAGATASYTLSLASDTGVDSGLFYSGGNPENGAKIYLFEENGKIVGRVGNKGADGAADTPDKSGNIALEVSVDASGVVKVQLGRGVQHSDPNDPNDVVSMAADAITLTATVTDASGNSASASLKLGSNIRIKDSAPSISAWDWLAPRVLEVDESDLGTDATQGFSRNFHVTAEEGIVGQAATSVTLSLASETGVDSGVIDAATGAKIFLFQGATSGEIVGRVGTKGADGAADTADANGAVAFMVSVADLLGNIRLDQKRGLKHGDPNNANEFVSLAADSITMTVTITDYDGDSASGDLKLGSNIRFKDDVPTANDDRDTVAKDGAIVATGNVVTGVDVGTNPDANGRDGVADALGADGFGSIAWTGASNGSVAGTHGTLSVGTDGSYRYTLNNDSAAVRALTAGQTLTETFTYRVTDKDGDSATASLTVTIYGAQGDLPAIAATAAAADVLEVDETDASTAPPYRSEATANFADNFTVNAGTGATVSYTLSLASDTGVDSGLFYSSGNPENGAKIYLFEENGKIVGRVGKKGADGAADTPDPNGRIPFEVTVDASGVVKVILRSGVKHSDPNDPNDVVSMAAGAITLTATVTDASGNSASADLKLGGNIRIKDDAPSLGPRSDVALRVLEVDESDLGSDATTRFDINFEGRATEGIVGLGASSVILSLASSTGVDSGVTDAATGARIFLFQGATSGEIVGRVGTKGAGGAADTADANGIVAFALSVVDSRLVRIELDQKRALKHGDPNNANETVSLAADSITLTVGITDNDGDSTSADLKLGSNIRFKDDALTARNDADSVTEDGATVATGNVITGVDVGTNPDANTTDGVADALGADGFGSIAWTGASNGSVAGTYGTLSVGTDGSYRYTLNNDLAAVQALKSGETLTETFAYRVTDKDGDSATASLTVTINGADEPRRDVPRNNDTAPLSVTVHEGALTGGNADTGQTKTATISATALASRIDAGTDGPISFAFNGAVSGAVKTAAGADVTSGGEAVTWRVVTDTAGKATGIDGVVLNAAGDVARTVFELRKSGDDFSLDLKGPLDHPAGGGGQTGGQTLGLDLSSAFKAVDKSGDAVVLRTAVTASVRDDAPANNDTAAWSGLTVSEYGVTRAVGDLNNDQLPSIFIPADDSLGGVGLDNPLLQRVDAGGDGLRGLDFNEDVSGAVKTAGGADVTSRGEAVTWRVVTDADGKTTGIDGVVLNAAGGVARTVFTVRKPNDSFFRFDLKDGLDHGASGQTLGLDLSPMLKAVDGDGDSVVLNSALTLNVRDDGPEISVAAGTSADALAVDESALGTDATANFADNFTVNGRADGVQSVTYALSVGSETGVDSGVVDTATGAKVFLFSEGGKAVGRVGTKGAADAAGAVAFEVGVDANGRVTLDQKRALKHGDRNKANEPVSLAADVITLTATVTDGDGGSASAGVKLGANLTFRDDGPTARNDADSVTEDGATVATGNVVTGVDLGTNPDANATDGVADALGADGFGAIAWTGASGGSVAGTHGTLSVGADGSYRYTLNNDSASVQALKSGETLTETFTYKVTDKDGDSATASLTVTIDGADEPAPPAPPTPVTPAVPLPSLVKKGGGRPENLFGTAQAEILAGLGGGDNLFGFGGDDVLVGGAGGDNLFGGAGKDILFGGPGNDFLKGNNHFGWNSSPDIFVLSAGRDTIADFKPGEDKINLFQVIDTLAKNGGGSFQSIVDKINAGGSSSPLSIQASGRDATVSLDGTVKAVLKGVSADRVSLSDFEFDNKLQDLASALGTDAF